jgi:nicotinamidase-related amidase
MINLPTFYQPQRVGTLYAPAVDQTVAEGVAAGLTPARDDKRRVVLLLVDPQVDFIHTDGALSVPGAVDDTRRTIDWIFEHAGELTGIAASLDSHTPMQIFFPTWWVDSAGQHPAPFTVITSRDVDQGVWQAIYEPQWSVRYVHALEVDAKKQLMIWPYHTLMGTVGHGITPALYEAITFHSAARQTNPALLTKGAIPKTEHYSILEPEVKVPGEPQGDLNTKFLDLLNSYDLIYVAGQAKSHCVLETLTSVALHYQNQPEKLTKWRVLTDCSSSVAHPEIDFDALANQTLRRYAERGLRLVTSEDPIG